MNKVQYTIGAILFLIVSIAIVLSFSFDVTTVRASNTTLLATNSSQIISPVDDGVVSSSASVLNNSYLSFDGVDDYVNNSLISYTFSNFTISFWINIKSLGNISESSHGSIFGTSGGQNRFNLYLSDDNSALGLLGFQNRNATSATASVPSLENMTVPIYSWNYYAITVNETHLKGYKNGILVNQKVLQNPNALYNSTGLVYYLGRDAWNNNKYGSFNIDEIRFYINSSLTDAQITEIYNSGRKANSSLPSTGLVAWYPMNEANGTVVHDASGNGNDGVLYG